MLFQHIPYDCNKDDSDNTDTFWDDSWHKTFKPETPSERNTIEQNHVKNCVIQNGNIQSKKDQKNSIEKLNNESDLLKKQETKDLLVDENFKDTLKSTKNVLLVPNRENIACKVGAFTALKEKNAPNSFKSNNAIHSTTSKTFTSKPLNQNHTALHVNKNVCLAEKKILTQSKMTLENQGKVRFSRQIQI
jgi:hypothetical protein